MKHKIEAIVERGDGEFFIRLDKGNALLTGTGKTITKALHDLQFLISDHKKYGGKTDKFYSKIDAKQIEWSLVFDVEAFFAQYDAIKQGAIAERAGINPSLIRQYASGVKYPSSEQVIKIQNAIHEIANEYRQISLVA